MTANYMFDLDTIEKLAQKCNEYKMKKPYIMSMHRDDVKRNWEVISQHYGINDNFDEFAKKIDRGEIEFNGFIWIFNESDILKFNIF